MKLIPVGKFFAQVDDEDYNRLIAVGSWTLLATKAKLYAKHDWKKNGKRGSWLMHRMVLGVENIAGASNPVDHKDHDGLNNQKANLRHGNTTDNNLNRQYLQNNNSSGSNGVYWNTQKQKWHAECHRNGKKIHVGFFNSLEEATEARLRKEQTL